MKIRESVRKEYEVLSSMALVEDWKGKGWSDESEADLPGLGLGSDEQLSRQGAAEPEAERSPECPRNPGPEIPPPSMSQREKVECPMAPAVKMVCPGVPGPRHDGYAVTPGPFKLLFTVDLEADDW
jgi:hypothetical protein